MTTKFSGTVPGQSRSPADEDLARQEPPAGSDAGTALSSKLELAAKLVLSENQRMLTSIDWLTIETLISSLSHAERVFVLGGGRSGLAVRMVAMRLMHLGRRVHVVGETTTPALSSGDVLLVVSGSGQTSAVVMAAEQAGAAGGRIVAVTAGASSALAAIADLVVLIPAANKHDRDSQNSAQFAGSLFEQTTLLLFDAVFYVLSHQLGKTTEALWAEHANLQSRFPARKGAKPAPGNRTRRPLRTSGLITGKAEATQREPVTVRAAPLHAVVVHGQPQDEHIRMTNHATSRSASKTPQWPANQKDQSHLRKSHHKHIQPAHLRFQLSYGVSGTDVSGRVALRINLSTTMKTNGQLCEIK